jgi:hypothetical protein
MLARYQPDMDRLQPVLRTQLQNTDSSAIQRRQAQDMAWQWVGAKWARVLHAVDDRYAPEIHVVQAGVELQVVSRDKDHSWALSLAHRDRDHGRTWLTRAAVAVHRGEAGDVDLFSVETTCTAMEPAPRVLAPPGVLKLWVDRLGLDDGGIRVSGKASEVSDDSHLEAFFRHVESAHRRLPVLALCHQPRSRYYGVDPQALATAVQGLAHVACFTPQTSAAVQARWGQPLAPVAGAARLYPPGFADADLNEEPAPLWRDLQPLGTAETVEPSAYRRSLCQRLCAWTVSPRARPPGAPAFAA